MYLRYFPKWPLDAALHTSYDVPVGFAHPSRIWGSVLPCYRSPRGGGGLGIRLRRICSRESDYLKRRGELKSYLRKRGYSSTFIESQLVKVDKMDRSDFLVYKDKKKNQNRVPLVVTYAKQLPDIQKISRDHMPLLHNSERMQHIFSRATTCCDLERPQP